MAASTSSSASASAAAADATSVLGILSKLRAEYMRDSVAGGGRPVLRLVDTFLALALAVAGLQFAYCALVGTFPFNSFLSGFAAAVGVFVLTGACFACVLCVPACTACSACCLGPLLQACSPSDLPVIIHRHVTAVLRGSAVEWSWRHSG